MLADGQGDVFADELEAKNVGVMVDSLSLNKFHLGSDGLLHGFNLVSFFNAELVEEVAHPSHNYY